MFGELVGVWLADLWQRAGRPDRRALCRARPGPRHARRGRAAGDARRRARRRRSSWSRPARCCARAQAERVAGALARRSRDPARATARCWSSPTSSSTRCRSASSTATASELRVGLRRRPLRPRRARSMTETSPASLAIVGDLAAPARRAGRRGADRRLRPRPARHRRHAAGGLAAMLMPIRSQAPGERDLTAHVDFSALAEAARGRGRARLRPGRRRATGSRRWGSSCAPPRSPRPRPSAPRRSPPPATG